MEQEFHFEVFVNADSTPETRQIGDIVLIMEDFDAVLNSLIYPRSSSTNKVVSRRFVLPPKLAKGNLKLRPC